MKPRWHYLKRGAQSPHGDWARRPAIASRTMLADEEQQARFAMPTLSSVPDEEFTDRWEREVGALEKASRNAQTAVRRAGWGREPWPDDIAWVQDYGQRRWPPLFCAMSTTFELLDERGEELLRRVAPAGEWSTCDGLLLDRDWQPATTHKVLVVERTIPMRVWVEANLDSIPRTAIADDVPDGAWIARHATRDGMAAERLFFSPEAMANISKERRTPGMEFVEMPWASELEDQARVEGWKRIE